MIRCVNFSVYLYGIQTYDKMEGKKMYAAAAIDSGSFFQIRNARGYIANLRIRRSSPEIINQIHADFGGYTGKTKDKDVYWLNFHGPKCTEFLIQILPYLKVKLEHAKIILEFNDHIKQRMASGIKSGSRLDPDEIAYRESMMLRLKKLNE